MNRELVSVIIPAYNCAEFICEAIDSALAQTYPNIEVIIVDSSTDDTRERLSKYGDRVRYFYQPPRGLSAARNFGVQQARGEWIALLDADDVWHAQKTEVQLRAVASQADCALVGSARANVLPSNLEASPKSRPLGVEDFLISMPIGPSGTILRRRTLEAVGLFDESLSFVEDRDMWLRMAAKFPCVCVECPCWWYRVREGQMSRDAQGNYESYKRVLAKFFEEHAEYSELQKSAWAHFYADSSWTYFEAGHRGVALSFAARSFWLRPIGYDGPNSGRRWDRTKSVILYLGAGGLVRILGNLGPRNRSPACSRTPQANGLV